MFLVGCTIHGMLKNKNKNHMDVEAKVDLVQGGPRWTQTCRLIGMFLHLFMCL